jgi:hypothetical protein
MRKCWSHPLTKQSFSFFEFGFVKMRWTTPKMNIMNTFQCVGPLLSPNTTTHNSDILFLNVFTHTQNCTQLFWKCTFPHPKPCTKIKCPGVKCRKVEHIFSRPGSAHRVILKRFWKWVRSFVSAVLHNRGARSPGDVRWGHVYPNFFPTTPIKLAHKTEIGTASGWETTNNSNPLEPIKLSSQSEQGASRRLLIIATHLNQSNYLANQKQGAAVNKYDLTVFIRRLQGSSRALKAVLFSRSQQWSSAAGWAHTESVGGDGVVIGPNLGYRYDV